jgi:hypothetical protein
MGGMVTAFAALPVGEFNAGVPELHIFIDGES